MLLSILKSQSVLFWWFLWQSILPSCFAFDILCFYWKIVLITFEMGLLSKEYGFEDIHEKNWIDTRDIVDSRNSSFPLFSTIFRKKSHSSVLFPLFAKSKLLLSFSECQYINTLLKTHKCPNNQYFLFSFPFYQLANFKPSFEAPSKASQCPRSQTCPPSSPPLWSSSTTAQTRSLLFIRSPTCWSSSTSS